MARSPNLANRVLDGRYELHELIGEGTFGRVYRAHDVRLDRDVAVKVIKPWWAEDPVWVERFAREARTLARVSHSGIVQIFDVGETSDAPYYVSELIEGGSLADRLQGRPLPPAEAVDIALQLCRALANAHGQHVVHRDVKPANILLAAGGRVKVGDFGVARLADGSSHGAAATAIGTPRYMSPEQARGGAISPASDVYGVGVVLYEMLTGRPPFHGDSAVEVAVRHLNDPPPPLPAAVPRELAAIVERALAKDPGDRYSDAGAMADAIAAIPPASLRFSVPVPASRAEAPAAATAATAFAPTHVVVEPPADATVVAPRRPPPPPRRPSPTAARRRRIVGALLLLAFAAGLVTILVVGGARTVVPQLRGLKRAAAAKRVDSNHLKAAFSSRYSDSAKKGIVLAQQPRAGKRVDEDSTVRVVLSAGPRPVPVPGVVGDSLADAQRALSAKGLYARVTRTPAPGRRPGTVLSQSPAASASAPPGSTIALTVVQAPRWRTVTSFASTGGGDGRSVPFRIRGDRWRVTYTLRYAGSCGLFLICFGPSAEVVKLPGSEHADGFDLNEGDAKTHELSTGPGIFQVKVAAGDDATRWSMSVQDYY